MKTVQLRPLKKYVQGHPPLQRHGIIKSTPLEGRAAPSLVFMRSFVFLCSLWLVTGQSDSLYIHFRSVTLWLASHHLLIICTPEPSSDSHWEFDSSSRSWKLFKKRCLNQRVKIICRLVMLDLCQLIHELWAHVGRSHSLLDCPPPVVGCPCPRPLHQYPQHTVRGLCVQFPASKSSIEHPLIPCSYVWLPLRFPVSGQPHTQDVMLSCGWSLGAKTRCWA